MSKILYYSNYCENSKKLLSIVVKSNIKKDIHFICIDKRIKRNNKTYIVLENNNEIVLPDSITCVPSILIINENYRVITGDDIYKLINPIIEKKNKVSCSIAGEPSAYTLSNNYDNVCSDNFSFLDQNTEELSTKGNGGTRQMYNYASVDFLENINTPPDDYSPDKVGDVDIEKLQKSRNN
tara:strand:- start:1233 stop:1775 length:543 start_codon:yes stop_codon:yes gene_type:complete